MSIDAFNKPSQIADALDVEYGDPATNFFCSLKMGIVIKFVKILYCAVAYIILTGLVGQWRIIERSIYTWAIKVIFKKKQLF